MRHRRSVPSSTEARDFGTCLDVGTWQAVGVCLGNHVSEVVQAKAKKGDSRVHRRPSFMSNSFFPGISER